MQIAVAKELHHVVSPAQYGFQEGKYIGEAIALAQLTSAFCSRHGRTGLLLLHDGEKAYDRVQWGWLQEVLGRMGFPQSLRDVIGMFFTDLQSQIKVNGVLGTPFDIKNSVKQGCPLSPYLYILSLQPLLDTLHNAPGFRGIRIPRAPQDTADGDEMRCGPQPTRRRAPRERGCIPHSKCSKW